MRKPSPAVIIASVALFFSVVGTGLAAGKYLITSTSQIKPSVLRELRGAQGPQGIQGATGPAGQAGAPGAAGAAGAQGATGSFGPTLLTTIVGNDVALCALGGGSCNEGDSVADCPSGDVVLSGGWIGEDSLPPLQSSVAYNQEDGSSGWEVTMVNDDSGAAADYAAFAVCAS